ncbi:hypothetical protein EDB85DRAFT_2069305 [Lactarius pseudohatsudake]|nr:hypothetical protein EDB85DRAFT_2069305 [Lactarius pseudohatsudake]
MEDGPLPSPRAHTGHPTHLPPSPDTQATPPHPAGLVFLPANATAASTRPAAPPSTPPQLHAPLPTHPSNATTTTTTHASNVTAASTRPAAPPSTPPPQPQLHTPRHRSNTTARALAPHQPHPAQPPWPDLVPIVLVVLCSFIK